MRPSKRPLRRRHHRLTAPLVAICGLAGSVPQTRAHALLLSRGEAVISSDRVEITLETATEDFLHYYGLSEDLQSRFSLRALADAVERFGAELCDVIVVRRADGEALPCDAFVLRRDWPDEGFVDLAEVRRRQVTYTTAYRGLGSAAFVTFHLSRDSQPMEIPWQIVLAVRGADQEQGQIVRITSRGNAETVELVRHDGNVTVRTDEDRGTAGGACAPFDARGSARFKEVFAEIEPEGEGVRARLSIPLPLLETWMDLPRKQGGSINDAELAAVAGPLRSLTEGAMLLEIDGRNIPAEVRSTEFLGPQSTEPGAAAADYPLSLFTSRVVAELWFPCGSQPRQLILHWKLLNNAVLSAWAAIHYDGVCTEHLFSAYRPDHSWTCGS